MPNMRLRGARLVPIDNRLAKPLSEGMALTANSISTQVPAPDLRPGAPRRWPGAVVRRAIVLGTLTLSAVGVALLWPSPPRTHQIQMITDVEPHRNLLGQQIREEGHHHHLDLVLSAKNYGALEALDKADSASEAKLALVTGGITARKYPRVREVTALTNEPLHVLVRPELAAGGWPALRAKRVHLGPPTTASHHLAREVLAFVGLMPTTDRGSGGYTLESTSPEDLHRQLGHIEALRGPDRAQAAGKLPDAVVFLAPLPSPLARRLVTGFGYHLLPVPFAEAFSLNRLNPPNSDGIRIDRSLMGAAVIPPYTYGGDPPAPLKPYPTIAAPLLLIAQDDTDPEVVFRLLETIHDSPLENAIHPPPLGEQVAAFPFHPGAERFLRRHEPPLSPETAARLGTVAGGIASFASGSIALYTFLRLRKLRRFESYYREVSLIELIARGQMVDPDAPTDPDARRAHLETRLSALKCRVVEDFAEGGLRGEGLVAGIIALINDTRESLARAAPDRGGR